MDKVKGKVDEMKGSMGGKMTEMKESIGGKFPKQSKIFPWISYFFDKGVGVVATPDGVWHKDSHYRSQLKGGVHELLILIRKSGILCQLFTGLIYVTFFGQSWVLVDRFAFARGN